MPESSRAGVSLRGSNLVAAVLLTAQNGIFGAACCAGAAGLHRNGCESHLPSIARQTGQELMLRNHMSTDIVLPQSEVKLPPVAVPKVQVVLVASGKSFCL